MVHNPPGTHLDEFIDGFNELLKKVRNGVSHIAMKDFNFNLLDVSNQNDEFLNL